MPTIRTSIRNSLEKYPRILSVLRYIKYSLYAILSEPKRIGIIRKLKNKHYIEKLKNGDEAIKLDVCGGRYPHNKDYLNVDILRFPGVDIRADITRKIPVSDDCVSEIISKATLEHFIMQDIITINQEFFRILIPGGKLVIGVPDLKALCEAYKSGNYDHDVLNRYFLGGQKDAFDIHKTLMDFQILSDILSRIGFCDIQQQDYDLGNHLPQYMLKIVCYKSKE